MRGHTATVARVGMSPPETRNIGLLAPRVSGPAQRQQGWIFNSSGYRPLGTAVATSSADAVQGRRLRRRATQLLGA